MLSLDAPSEGGRCPVAAFPQVPGTVSRSGLNFAVALN